MILSVSFRVWVLNYWVCFGMATFGSMGCGDFAWCFCFTRRGSLGYGLGFGLYVVYCGVYVCFLTLGFVDDGFCFVICCFAGFAFAW